MQRKKIPPSSWRIIETIVIRYPEKKQEYKTILEQILDSSSYNDGQPKGNSISNQTEGVVLKLNSPRILRMEAEVDAVEKAFEQMNYEAKDLIEKRFWSEGGRRKTPYCYLHNIYMSERTMQNIVHDFFEIVGKEMGEI